MVISQKCGLKMMMIKELRKNSTLIIKKNFIFGGAICIKGKFPLYSFNKTVNSEEYCHCLENIFLPNIKLIFKRAANKLIFQQDNARPHVSKNT